MYIPKISVITPSYNQGNFIEQTIQSVIGQNYPNLEYIIIDGGSTDNTIDIIKKYENKLAYWISEPDKGQAHAINKGLKRCTGDIIGWLNSDDLLVPNSFFEIASHFPSLTAPVILSGEGRFFNEKGIVWEPTECDGNLTHINYTKAMLLRSWKYSLHQPSTFWNKALMEQIGYINEDLYFAMDLDYWLRIISVGVPIYKFQKMLSEFRLHETSKTVSENTRLQKDLLALSRQHLYGIRYYYYLLQFYTYFNSYRPAKQIIKSAHSAKYLKNWFKAVLYYPLSIVFAPRLMGTSLVYALGGRKVIKQLKNFLKF